MERIATFGVFDILHPGHIKFLKKCKKLAKNSELIVVIARDTSVIEDKGRKPTIPEEHRRYIVESLKHVDRAILGKEGSDKLKIVEEIKPDIIVLGYDQTWDEKDLERKLQERGLKIRVMRLKKYGETNSTSIKKKMKI